MIHFAWPWLALLAPLPWVHYRWRAAAAPPGTPVFVPFLGSVDTPAVANFDPRRVARMWFTALWCLLILAAIRPQVLGDPVPVPTTGRRLLLAVDVSGSMATPDMGDGVTRLDAVQQVAGRFIDGRHGDQVGLILFGTQPYLQAPLTSDLLTVHRFLNEAVVGIAGPQTAIGDAIGLALKRLSVSDGNDRTGDAGAAKHSVLVLLTDGESNAGAMPPLEAARLAHEAGLRIYTIGVGAVAQEGFFGTQGNTDLDEDTLKAIARITGGEYFRAVDANTLQSVYRRIDELEPAAGREQWLRPAQEWFSVPLGVALLLSVAVIGLGSRQWP